MIKMGVQGEKGSFSEQAGISFARSMEISDYTLDYLVSSANVLKAVEAQIVDYGIIAIENSRAGVVIESIKALAKYRCRIEKMFHIPISQNLLVKKGVHLEDITEVHSHEQALRQCQDFLAKQFWGLPLIEENDTADSARRLSIGELSVTTAVIGNKNCVDLYGLELLQGDIHDLKNNLTLFLGLTTLNNE